MGHPVAAGSLTPPGRGGRVGVGAESQGPGEGADGKVPYTVGGALLALVCFFGTFAVVRGDRREKAAAEAGTPRAERLWRPAHYCYGCTSVFCPGDTPEQFKKLVWTEAGYGDQPAVGDMEKEAEVPSGVLPGRLQESVRHVRSAEAEGRSGGITSEAAMPHPPGRALSALPSRTTPGHPHRAAHLDGGSRRLRVR